MPGNLLFWAARWMSRRNGRSLAHALFVQLREKKKSFPNLPQRGCWQEVLSSRPGWRRVSGDRFEFVAGKFLELDPSGDPMRWLAQIARVEVKPLSQGMPSPHRAALEEETISAALTWWENHAAW